VEQRLEGEQISADQVEQMLELAERLREAHGGDLDDEAIVAVAEATGAPIDYVRIAVARRPKEQTQTVTKKLRGSYLSLDPEERAWVTAGALGAGAGIAYALNVRLPRSNGLFEILMIIMVVIGLYAVATRKDARMATISGAILGAVSVIASSVFGLLLGLGATGSPMMIIPLTFVSAFAGFALHKVVSQNRKTLGLRDPAVERQDLLRQLHELQAQLESGKQSLTFLSVDMVGSTRMKVGADPLKVEFTFNEYHKFVEMATTKYDGRIHSTAGDGVTCAFDDSHQAFRAALFMQTAIFELNTFRNQLGKPIVLRCGIHTGDVVAPDAHDVTSVNFAHVIDIAAHLQKVCPEGGIVISQLSASEIPRASSVIGSERLEVDGITGYVWRPKTKAAPIASEAPPPFAPEQA
jgi:class 3 adenylate cyclase